VSPTWNERSAVSRARQRGLRLSIKIANHSQSRASAVHPTFRGESNFYVGIRNFALGSARTAVGARQPVGTLAASSCTCTRCVHGVRRRAAGIRDDPATMSPFPRKSRLRGKYRKTAPAVKLAFADKSRLAEITWTRSRWSCSLCDHIDQPRSRFEFQSLKRDRTLSSDAQASIRARL